MMTVILTLVGALPFLLGFLYSSLLWSHPQAVLSYSSWIALVVLLLWGGISWLGTRFSRTVRAVVIPMHLVALAVLVLLGIQEFLVGHYWLNAVGRWSQMFDSAVFPLASRLCARWSLQPFPAHCLSFLLLVGFSLAGCWLGKRFGKP